MPVEESDCHICNMVINLELAQIEEQYAKDHLCKTHYKKWKEIHN